MYLRGCYMKLIPQLLILLALLLSGVRPALSAPLKKLDKPPLTERWYGIYVDNDRVGFYRQKISETADGYLIEANGIVRLKVMGFSKEVAMRESYQAAKNMTLRSFDVEQTINGDTSRVSGRVNESTLRAKSESNGKTADKQIRFKGDIYPVAALNIFPLMRDATPGKTHKAMTFDAEEIKIKEVKISVIGDEKTPEGLPATRLRNNLYPFVNNDVWVDTLGNTLYESVRDGLVTTRAEDPKQLGAFVGNLVVAKKDLIYDFSLIRVEPPIKDVVKLTGLVVELSGWNDGLPLFQNGGQVVEKNGEGRITVRTGSAVPPPVAPTTVTVNDQYLKPAEKIESDAPEIVAKSKELSAGKSDAKETARALASWTAEWLNDTIEDSGGALASMKARTGNCQTHARLYTALARAAGIPTRFVSGLVYQEGQGFLYHSWTESYLENSWVAVDPTYNQLPADPTHLKFFEGHTPNDLSPIIAIIGKIRATVLETKYN
ncbi:MAG TPA: transglutaminase domain-containing protein [Desulfuromonadales bacterium]|nr:transglutaminase domain-containing protein [Desulfuromonadales bacterium]